MTAFNFKPEFVPKIETGEKKQTIRQTKRCEVGDDMQLYTGQRTKSCRKIADAVCTDVFEVIVTGDPEQGYYTTAKPCGGMLYELDGFSNVLKFCEFFKNQYGLTFTGYVHKWRLK